MDKRGVRPTSKRRSLRNRPGSRNSHRTVDYRSIDRGVSRPQVNRAIRQGRPESERDLWEAVDRDAVQREQQGLRDIHRPPTEGKVVSFQKPAQRAAQSPKLGTRASSPRPAEPVRTNQAYPKNRSVDGRNAQGPERQTRVEGKSPAPPKLPSFSERLRQARGQLKQSDTDQQREQVKQPPGRQSFSEWLRSPEAKKAKAASNKDKSRDRDHDRDR